MTGYQDVMDRRSEILTRSGGLDYASFKRGSFAFDWQGLVNTAGSWDDVTKTLRTAGVGNTPLLELSNLTELVRRNAAKGKGARIVIKDEAANPSGSFKDRRAALSAYEARSRGFDGLVAATSGNYGAAVASQAARHGLRAIIVQEAFDSDGRGQPEIIEKGRKCEALGAEVIQTSVGPELFYMLLRVLDETGYFNASLYTPYSIAGIQSLGVELVEQVRDLYGRDPAAVLATHAGGGLVTGTGMGLRRAGAKDTQLVGVSVDLRGLHMASDRDFNRKSFTTGHTGFSIPFTSWPDRVDVPLNAARPLRFLDRMVLVGQGSVFFVTELLARTEGLERGPAGNTSLAAALAIAAELDEDEVVVVNETEYTGAGKNPAAQLEFAKTMGIEVTSEQSSTEIPGKRIVIPTRVEDIKFEEVDLGDLRQRYVQNSIARSGSSAGQLTPEDWSFLSAETRLSDDEVRAIVEGVAR